MRTLATLFFMASIALILGCATTETTEPDPGNGDPADDYTEVASGAIDTGGGSLEGGGMVLGVPAGAFSESAELELLVSTSENRFEEVGDSTSYRIDGIPIDFGGPLRLAIQHEGTATKVGEGFVAVGEPSVAPGTGEEIVGYTVLSAVDSAGYLVCEFAPPEESGTGKFAADVPTTVSLNAQVLADVGPQLTPQGMFRVTHCGGESTSGAANDLGLALERIHTRLGSSHNLDLGEIRDWPVDVTVKYSANGPYGRFLPSWRGVKYGSLEFNTKYINDTDSLDAVCARELMRFFQNHYELRGYTQRLFGSDPDHLWWNEAVAAFMEEVEGARTIPSSGEAAARTVGLGMAPFQGIHRSPADGGRFHGYGLGTLPHHISAMSIRTPSKIKPILEGLRSGDDIIEAINSELGPVSDWLPVYFADLARGEYPKKLMPATTVLNVDGLYQISSEFDIKEVFTHDYRDLSAALYRVDLEYAGIDPGAVLSFRTTGRTANITVFTINTQSAENVSLDEIASFTDEAVVEDVKQHIDDGLDLLALVTNSRAVEPYDESTTIELNVEVLSQPDYKACEVIVDLHGVTRYTTDSGTNDVEGGVRSFVFVEGSFSGRTFSGSLSEDEFDGQTDATILITLDESFEMVESFSVWKKKTQFYTDEWSAEGGGVPLDYRLPDEMVFVARDGNACDAVSSYEMTEERFDYTAELQSFDCEGTGNEVEIIFWREAPKNR